MIKIELEKDSSDQQEIKTNKYNLFYHTLPNVAITLSGK